MTAAFTCILLLLHTITADILIPQHLFVPSLDFSFRTSAFPHFVETLKEKKKRGGDLSNSWGGSTQRSECYAPDCFFLPRAVTQLVAWQLQGDKKDSG